MRQKEKVLVLASVASMISQFNMPNIRLLLDMGFEVHIACNFKKGSTCSRQEITQLQKALRKLQVTCHQWDCPRDIFPISQCFRAYWQLRQLIKRHQFAWMHCHSPVGGVLARLAAGKKLPVVYTAHGFHFYKGAPVKNWLLYYPVEKLLASRTDLLITLNQEDYCLAKRSLFVGKACYIPGVGIDTSRFCSAEAAKRELCRKYRIPQDALLLVSAGELSKRKNHRIVIEALAAMQRQDVYYLLCGQGALREKLRRYADKAGVLDHIRMPGYQEQMSWIFQNADVFVFPSIQEGMPVALMEAMAAGLPCVVSDIRGNRELVDDAEKHSYQDCGGIRFSYNKPEELQQALTRMLEDQQLRVACGRYNKEKIKSYELAAVQARMKVIYRYMSRLAADQASIERRRGGL